MSDLIERAAAQTELMMKCERYTLARESHGMGHVEWSSDLISVADAMDAIRDLPSAQPEIVRCGQCKYAEVADAQDNQDGYTCQFHRWSIWFSGSYCSWGERRTDDANDIT